MRLSITLQTTIRTVLSRFRETPLVPADLYGGQHQSQSDWRTANFGHGRGQDGHGWSGAMFGLLSPHPEQPLRVTPTTQRERSSGRLVDLLKELPPFGSCYRRGVVVSAVTERERNQAMDRINALAAEAWDKWPMRTAAGDAARRSHVRSHLSGEMSYALIQRYDQTRGDLLSPLIDRLLADTIQRERP